MRDKERKREKRISERKKQGNIKQNEYRRKRKEM